MDSGGLNKVTYFQQRLAETRMWCPSRVGATDPATQLRTTQLRPFELMEIGDGLWGTSVSGRQQIVEQLATRRSLLLQTQNSALVPIAQASAGGCILVFDLDGSLSDGAAEVATQGFF